MRRHIKRASVEAAVLAAVGLLLGLVINTFSTTRLSLAKNHFRSKVQEQTALSATPLVPATDARDDHRESAPKPDEEEPLSAISHADLVELFQSDGYLEERHVIIDARDDVHYVDGHIPGAFQFDHYRADRYMEEILPVCQNAERIVLYCNGGKCDDSKLAAIDLMDNGITPEKILIYQGGIVQWQEDGLPLERAERLSDDLYYSESEG